MKVIKFSCVASIIFLCGGAWAMEVEEVNDPGTMDVFQEEDAEPEIVLQEEEVFIVEREAAPNVLSTSGDDFFVGLVNKLSCCCGENSPGVYLVRKFGLKAGVPEILCAIRLGQFIGSEGVNLIQALLKKDN